VQITGAVLAVACAIQIVLFMRLKALAGNIFSELLIIAKVLEKYTGKSRNWSQKT